MAVSRKALSATVLVVLIVHGLTSDVLEKIHRADEWSAQHAHDKDVEDDKGHHMLKEADNQTPVLSSPSAYPYNKAPSPTVDTKSVLQIPSSGVVKKRKRRHLDIMGTPFSSIKCPKCSPHLSDELTTHGDPVAEPNSLIIPTSSANLPSPSFRASDQRSHSDLSKPSTLPDFLLQPGTEEPFHMEEIPAHNLTTKDFDLENVLGNNAMLLDPSFSPSSFLRSLCPNQRCENWMHFDNPDDHCCIPCDCTEECNATGTCCADYPEYGVMLNTTQPASSTREVCTDPALHTAFRFEPQYYQSYMMVSTCSPLFREYKDQFTLSYLTKCEQPDELTMDSLTPVYHAETGLTYRNIFCATCNFATEDITRWVPMLMGRQFFETYFLFDTIGNTSDLLQQANLSGLCDVTWYPRNLPNKPCLDRQNLVSKCSLPASPTLQAYCEEDEFTAPFKFNNIVFKNAFCLQCTTGVPIHQNTCTKEGDKLELILDVDHLDAVDETVAETLGDPQYVWDGDEMRYTCTDGYELDMDLRACRKMSCSVSKFNVSGVCQPMFDEADGLSLQFSLILVYRHAIPPDEYVIYDARQFLPDNLELCQDYVTHNGRQRFAYLAVMTSSFMISIQAIFHEFEKKVNTNQKGSFTVEIGGHGYVSLLTKSYAHHDYSMPDKDIYCPSGLAMAKIQFCDTFLIDNVPECKSDCICNINGLIFKPSDFIIRVQIETLRSFIQICQDTLLHAISLQKSAYTSTVLCVHICFLNVAVMCLIAVLISNN